MPNCNSRNCAAGQPEIRPHRDSDVSHPPTRRPSHPVFQLPECGRLLRPCAVAQPVPRCRCPSYLKWVPAQAAPSGPGAPQRGRTFLTISPGPVSRTAGPQQSLYLAASKWPSDMSKQNAIELYSVEKGPCLTAVCSQVTAPPHGKADKGGGSTRDSLQFSAGER